MTTGPAPIGVQLYSLRDQLEADGCRAVLERLASIGFRGVETAGFHDLDAIEFGRVCADLGLALASGHIGLGSEDELHAIFDTHAAVGFDAVVVAALGPDEFTSATAVDGAAERLNAAARLADAHGLSLGYHNHFWEFAQIDGQTALDRLFASAGPNVFAEVDIYWATVAGVDPATVLRGLGDRARILHVKDGPADSPERAMVAVGQGCVDIAASLSAAPDARWHVVELDQCDTDMFDAVAQSYDYLVRNGLSTGRPT